MGNESRFSGERKAEPIDIEGLPGEIKELWNDFIESFMGLAAVVGEIREEGEIKADERIPLDLFLKHIDKAIPIKEESDKKYQAFLLKYNDYKKSSS